jgi:glucosamine-6-phosphate deaminase
MFPDYLTITSERLGSDSPVSVVIDGDKASLARHLAAAILEEFRAGQARGNGATLILPVGPVDQFPILAEMVNEANLDIRDAVIINMDEYLTDDDQWIPADHPLSFRGFMDRLFYSRLKPELAPLAANRIFPDPDDCGAIGRLIEARGGVDACFGGIGINGHMAFNEPPEPGETMGDDAFAALPTRNLSLSRETRTINSVTVGGETAVIPHRAVTVGMKEILEAKRCRFYCNRPWQSAVVRRVLHGPLTPACPASFLRTHPDASLTVTDYVAEPPDIMLR